MASFRVVGNVLLKTCHKQPSMRSVQCANAINLLPGAVYSSLSGCENKIVQEVKQSVWRFLSARRIHSCTSASCAISSDKTSSPANSAAKRSSDGPSYANTFNPALVEDLIKRMDGNMPVAEMPDPFEKEYHRCFLCRNNIHPDHKNVRLLSQFVSPYTGRIYGRAITGLCIPMQKHVSKLIQRARKSGFMPIIIKDPKYLQDPQPYDAMSKKSGS